MRYQSPVSNPLFHYWEEELVIGFDRRWKELLTTLRYYAGEYLFANLVLVYSVLKVIAVAPITDGARQLYYVYGLKWALKRVIDIAGSTVALVLAIPVFIIIPILIRFDSPGPVFFRQQRVGKNYRRQNRRVISVDGLENRRNGDRRKVPGSGRPFSIIKFRTMYHDAEQRTGPVWAHKNDPRITRIGSILRATRLDEVPQLLNILKGEMSLVGPRPEREFFVKKLRGVIESYDKRLLVRPGLTGLAQVEYKYDESVDDTKVKIKYDIDYIERVGILTDLKILFKTIYVVFAAKGI